VLKITVHKAKSGVRLALEGRLAGPWVEELERCWQEAGASGKGDMVVDLTGVTFIEHRGKVLLKRIWRGGGQLLASGCCIGPIVDEIRRQA
jgi:hypothetical protein